MKNSTPNERASLNNQAQVIHRNRQFPAEDLPYMEPPTEIYYVILQADTTAMARLGANRGPRRSRILTLRRLDCLVLKMEAENSTEASVINDPWKDLRLGRLEVFMAIRIGVCGCYTVWSGRPNFGQKSSVLFVSVR
jgi:hypothetical protein